MSRAPTDTQPKPKNYPKAGNRKKIKAYSKPLIIYSIRVISKSYNK